MAADPPAEEGYGGFVHSMKNWREDLPQWALALAIVVGSALIFVALKAHLRLPLRLPGHSALYLVPVLIGGKHLARGRTSALQIGLFSGLLGGWMGLDGGPFIALPKYVVMGGAVDLFTVGGSDWGRGGLTVLAGATANGMKLAVGWLALTATGIPALFAEAGMTAALVSHILFGAAGGLFGFALIRGGERFRGWAQTARG